MDVKLEENDTEVLFRALEGRNGDVTVDSHVVDTFAGIEGP